jgi:hypothetical protein
MPYSAKIRTPEEALEMRRVVARRWAKKNRANNLEKMRSYGRAYYDKNSAKFAEYRKSLKHQTYIQNWALENKGYYKKYRQAYHLFRQYGITVEERDALFAQFDGACHCCRQP